MNVLHTMHTKLTARGTLTHGKRRRSWHAAASPRRWVDNRG
jgi:hypothetical protein